MTDFKKYTHIIWDWNGTLLNDAWLCVDVMNGMLKERGLPLRTLDEYREMFDFPVRDYYEKLGYDFKKESFDIVGMEFILRYNERHFETSLHTGATKILGIFAAAGCRQFILSARQHQELIAETEKLGVGGFFERICGLDDHYAYGKSELGLKLARELDADHSKLLFIGDTRHDAEVAEGIGIDCILISHGHHSAERLKRLGWPVLDNLEQLLTP